MEQRFHILTNVIFRHTYFTGNTYRSFTVQPDAATQHHFNRLGLLFKTKPDGFTLIYETNPGLRRTREEILAEGLVFGFTIVNNDPDLLNYTDGLPDNIMDAVIYLRNKPAFGNVLHQEPFITVGDILQNRPAEGDQVNDRVFFKKPFGWLEFSLYNDLEENYYVNFKGKATIWRYIINSEHLAELSQPAVIHRDTKETFKGPVWIGFPDGKKRMAFESNGLIPLSSRPDKGYQLVENYDAGSGRYKIVLNVLPNPNIKLISLIGEKNIDNQNTFSEIFI